MTTSIEQARERLIVAVDVSSAAEALRLVEPLRGHAGWVKVGKQLFVAEGPSVVAKLRAQGFKIFLDLKFHDIPNTVAAAGIEALRLGVEMFNVHAAGGRRMMTETVDRVREEALRQNLAVPKMIAVTVLTSLEQADLAEVGLDGDPETWVRRWARLASGAGMDGVVCSPRETALLRREFGAEFLLVTPGIRAVDAPADDQRRTLSAGEAVRAGATMLVIGRPLTKTADPAGAADAFAREVAAVMDDMTAGKPA